MKTMNTKTKKPAKKTPKQTIAKINSLLNGIDNSVVVINKHKAVVNNAVKEVRSLMGGLSNNVQKALKKETKPVKKTVKAKPAEKKNSEKKTEKKAEKKVEKKLVVEKKVVEKPVEKKPEKAEKKPPKVKTKVASSSPPQPVEGRPSLKECIVQAISGCEPMTMSEAWHKTTEKWGYWSKQSLSKALKDSKVFTKNGNKFSVSVLKVDDDEAEKFIKKVDNNQAISNVQ